MSSKFFFQSHDFYCWKQWKSLQIIEIIKCFVCGYLPHTWYLTTHRTLYKIDLHTLFAQYVHTCKVCQCAAHNHKYLLIKPKCNKVICAQMTSFLMTTDAILATCWKFHSENQILTKYLNVYRNQTCWLFENLLIKPKSNKVICAQMTSFPTTTDAVLATCWKVHSK